MYNASHPLCPTSTCICPPFTRICPSSISICPTSTFKHLSCNLPQALLLRNHFCLSFKWKIFMGIRHTRKYKPPNKLGSVRLPFYMSIKYFWSVCQKQLQYILFYFTNYWYLWFGKNDSLQMAQTYRYTVLPAMWKYTNPVVQLNTVVYIQSAVGHFFNFSSFESLAHLNEHKTHFKLQCAISQQVFIKLLCVALPEIAVKIPCICNT